MKLIFKRLFYKTFAYASLINCIAIIFYFFFDSKNGAFITINYSYIYLYVNFIIEPRIFKFKNENNVKKKNELKNKILSSFRILYLLIWFLNLIVIAMRLDEIYLPTIIVIIINNLIILHFIFLSKNIDKIIPKNEVRCVL